MSSTKRNPKEELKQLQARKRLLEEMLGAADRVEQLHSGLNAAVQLGKPTRLISESALRFFEGLSAQVKALPTVKLKSILKQLEGRMAANLQMVMNFAERELDDPLNGSLEQTALDLINEFRRTSKTAVAMRILLSERGEVTQPMQLPVDPDGLRQQVNRMAQKEQEVRLKVQGDIVHIRDDAAQLLRTPNLPPGIQGMLRVTIQQMDVNLEHVRSGKGFDTMPFVMEVVEAKDTPEVEDIPEKLPLIEVEELPPEAVTPATPAQGQGGGIAGQIGNWLNSPWGVGWQDASSKQPGTNNNQPRKKR